jgi:hypothetical protein
MQTKKVFMATALVLTAVANIPAFAFYPDGPGGPNTVTKSQLERCKEIGIPEFTCTEQTLIARERIIEAEGGYGSGTAMLGESFGEMGIFILALAGIFGAVAAAFFSRSLAGVKIPA